MRRLALLLLLIVTLTVSGCNSNGRKKDISDSTKTVGSTETPATTKKDEVKPIQDDELWLANINLGISLAEFKKIHPQKPNSIKEGEDEEFQEITYSYKDGLEVYIVENSVYSIKTSNPNYPTKRGLKVGDTQDKLVKLYGQPLYKDGDIWQYNIHDEDYIVFYVTVKNGIITDFEVCLTM